MPAELGVVEQRYAAVREVLEGAAVVGVDVARPNGVARQKGHAELRPCLRTAQWDDVRPWAPGW